MLIVASTTVLTWAVRQGNRYTNQRNSKACQKTRDCSSHHRATLSSDSRKASCATVNAGFDARMSRANSPSFRGFEVQMLNFSKTYPETRIMSACLYMSIHLSPVNPRMHGPSMGWARTFALARPNTSQA